MAGRIRSLKPEWLDDEKLAAASDDARLLSVVLVLLADDYGNGRASPSYLAAEMWKYRRPDVKRAAAALAELAGLRYVILYTVDDQQYYSIRTWAKNQRVDRPGKPRVPGPSETLANIRETHAKIPESAANIREGAAKIPETPATDLRPPITDPDLDLRSGSPTPISAGLRPDVGEVFAHYRTYHPKAHPKPQSASVEYRKIAERLKGGYSVDDLKRAIDGYHRSPYHCGQNERQKVYQALELIVRDDGHVASGIEYADAAERGPPIHMSERERRGVEASLSWLEKQEAG